MKSFTATKKAIAEHNEHRKKNLTAGKKSAAPKNKGVTKRVAMERLEELGKSEHKIPAALKPKLLP